MIGWLQAQAVKLLGGALALSLLTLGSGLLVTRYRLAEARQTSPRLRNGRMMSSSPSVSLLTRPRPPILPPRRSPRSAMPAAT